MSLINVLNLFGGLSLFLFGIMSMSSAIEKVAGSKMESALERLAGNKYKGFLLGILVTAIIQSSSATTVMVVGFVNAGVMKLAQTVGIILGANIGTTVTSQILRLGDISSDNLVLQIFKPAGLTPIFLTVGFVLYITGKRRKRRDIGHVLVGFGILFTGMMTMEKAVEPLKDVVWFRELFIRFSNPFLGLLVGMVVTAILQSSSASVGILQAVSTTGVIPFSAAVPIILGQNIGTCFTAVLSSIGTNKNARRAAVIHLFFNMGGSILFLLFVFILRPENIFAFWNVSTDRGMIANFHLVFNVACALLALPFTNLLVKLSMKAVKQGDDEKEAAQLIDDRFLDRPSVALDQARATICQMAECASQNVKDAATLTVSFDQKIMQRVHDNEETLDRLEVKLENYLVRLSSRGLGKRESISLSKMLNLINNFERIGDYALNVAEAAEHMDEDKITLSVIARHELAVVFKAVREVLGVTIEVFKERDGDAIMKVEPLEEVVDLLADLAKQRHIERLKAGECSVETGTILVEILLSLERIADHCSNIAVAVSRTYGNNESNFNAHERKRTLHEGGNKEYTIRYEEHMRRYLNELGNQTQINQE